MQQADTGKSARVGHIGSYVLCGLACATVAGCGGANGASPAASVTGPAQTVATPAGSASLSWVAPSLNSDGSTLTNLAGYKLDYGTSSGALFQTVTISDPTATSYTVQGLASGTWYFAVADFTSTGAVSALSSVVSKTVQ